jgi:NADH-quinone oxidoreductase subunit I
VEEATNMVNSLKRFLNTFLLFELVKGLMVTGRHLFSRKITIQYRRNAR